MITGTTQILGVIGDPIAHSLSPVMHNAAIAHLGVDYVYLPFAITSANLATAIAGFEAIGVRGFSITIPHKQAIIPLLQTITPQAQAIGAVNTVWHSDQGWQGTNTDVAGFVAPLHGLDRPWPQTEALILGNGGAARAVVAGCAQLGFGTIRVVGRDRAKLQALQQSWLAATPPVPIHIHLWDELPTLLATAGLVVNTTPLGMHPHPEQCPIAPQDWANWNPAAIAYDLIYVPKPTQFLQAAAERGSLAIDGLEMLVQQGAAALEIWLQQPAPVEVMRRSLLQQLGLDSSPP